MSNRSQSIEPVSFEKHKDVRVRRSFTFDHIKDEQFIPINGDEFAYASTCYPIFFIKDRETAKFFPIALFGLSKNENLLHSSERWPVSYIPKLMGFAPFSMGANGSDESKRQLVVCIDASSPRLSSDEGEQLFDGENETPFLVGARQAFAQFWEGKQKTSMFIDRLLTEGLMKAVRLEMTYADGRSRVMDGLYTIDGERLKGLPEASVLEFHQKGYLPSIYSMINSHHNLYDLVKRKQALSASTPEEKLQTLQIADV